MRGRSARRRPGCGTSSREQVYYPRGKKRVHFRHFPIAAPGSRTWRASSCANIFPRTNILSADPKVSLIVGSCPTETREICCARRSIRARERKENSETLRAEKKTGRGWPPHRRRFFLVFGQIFRAQFHIRASQCRRLDFFSREEIKRGRGPKRTINRRTENVQLSRRKNFRRRPKNIFCASDQNVRHWAAKNLGKRPKNLRLCGGHPRRVFWALKKFCEKFYRKNFRHWAAKNFKKATRKRCVRWPPTAGFCCCAPNFPHAPGFPRAFNARETAVFVFSARIFRRAQLVACVSYITRGFRDRSPWVPARRK